MRVALFGDIHGNLPALERVLEHARERGAGEFWDLGDLTGYGPYPEEVVRVVSQVARFAVSGNYDRKVLAVKEKLMDWRARKEPAKIKAFVWARENLSPESLRFLEERPREENVTLEGLDFFLTHAAPGSWKEHLSPDTPRERLAELGKSLDVDVVCVGHSHRPFARKVGRTWFVNPGSVGRPEGGDPRAVYALLDLEGGKIAVTHYWLDYDRDRTVLEVRRRGLPESFARMFMEGRGLSRARRAGGAAPGYGWDELILAARNLSIQCVPQDQGHFLQVTRLALRLFDYLRQLHGRGDEDRILLQLAGLLHDIGWADGQKGHHKSSMRRILSASDLPLQRKERWLVALLARYHRRTLPREEHPLFRELDVEDRRRVRELACLLRIADGLDYSHDASVADLSVEISNDVVLVLCSSNHPLNSDIDRAMGKGGECFKSLFERELKIRWRRI